MSNFEVVQFSWTNLLSFPPFGFNKNKYNETWEERVEMLVRFCSRLSCTVHVHWTNLFFCLNMMWMRKRFCFHYLVAHVLNIISGIRDTRTDRPRCTANTSRHIIFLCQVKPGFYSVFTVFSLLPVQPIGTYCLYWSFLNPIRNLWGVFWLSFQNWTPA
jgi:hypothetical protein